MLENIKLTLNEDNNDISNLARALSSPQRLLILEKLNANSMTVKELSDALDCPLSTTLLNVNILEECSLITINEQFTKAGKSKLCVRKCDKVTINLFKESEIKTNSLSESIPIGNYVDYEIVQNSGCGIATSQHTIGVDNDSSVFFSNERFKAGYIWFGEGFLTYRANNISIPSKLSKISISMEICSEAPFYRNDWKSDITLFICDKEAATWTSKGDYGGRRGRLNPSWWPDALTQYGILTTWEIRKDGTYVNDVKISNFSLFSLRIKEKPYVDIKIGVKSDAHYKGGLSLFGSTFGDYSQEIEVTFYWD